ncbi:hypothetical protein [Bacillus phage SBSphiJ4]|nr:hypothetical protein [Bacillus phage SBSphiJ4]
MKKLIQSITLIGALTLGVTGVAAQSPQQAQAATEHHVRAKLTGWADMNSFEVKTSTGKVYIMRTTNQWYYKNLKEGQYYTYFYTVNKYGQNIITRINK